MRTKTKTMILLLVLALVALPAFIGCAKTATTPIPTATPFASVTPAPTLTASPTLTTSSTPMPQLYPGGTVTIGQFYASLYAGGATYDGLKDYIQYFNSQGGAYGVTVKVAAYDTGGQAQEASAGYTALKGEGAVLMVATSLQDATGSASQASKDKLPEIIDQPSEDLLYPPGYVWSTGLTDGQGIASYLHWIAEQGWDWQGKGRPPRFMLWFVDVKMATDMEKIGQAIANNLGITWCDPQVYPFPFPADWTPYVQRMKQEKPDYVFGLIVQLLAAHDSTGIPKDPNAKYCAMSTSSGEVAADYGQEAVGIQELYQLAGFDEPGIPGVKLMTQMHTANKRSTDGTYEYQYARGFDLGMEACELLRIAVADDGYPVTPEAVARAIYKLDFDAMGMTTRLKFPQDSRLGGTKFRIAVVTQTLQAAFLTDWKEAVPLGETLKAAGMTQ